MRKITALFILASLSAIPAFTQEMPADLKSKLEAKAAEMEPSSKSAAKTWLVKQMNAWESIQNLAFAADADDIAMIKKLAEKKFPLDYVSQETFINEQAVAAAGLPDLKSQIGKQTYDAIKAKFDKDGKTDLAEFINIINAQITAKTQLETLKPLPSIDASTFAITKEVLAKKFPSDYISQLNELKKLSSAVDAASDAGATAATAATAAPGAEGAAAQQGSGAPAGAAQAGAAAGDKKILTIAELNLIAREQFNKHTLTIEGETKVTGLPVKMYDKQVILIPFTVFSAGPNVSIMNNLGEQVDFDNTNIFASRDYPLVIVVPKGELPSTSVNANLPQDKNYREIIGKPIFFMGYTTTNVQIFPVKLNAVSEQTLVLSSRVPNNFLEGTILMNPEEDITLGMMLSFKKKYPNVKWNQRNSVNFLRRTIENKNPFLTCIRLDKLERWDKVDFEKLAQQRKKLDSLNKLLWDFILLNTSNRIVDTAKLAILGPTVSKYKDELKVRMEKSRFDRMFRQYLQDLMLMIKSEMRDVNPNEFYTLFRYDLNQTLDALKDVMGYYDNAIRTNSFTQLIPDDIKRAQNK